MVFPYSTRRLSSTEVEDILAKLTQELTVTTDRIRTIIKQFNEEMDKGLDHEGATVPMIPSFVTGRPTGKETGRYMALDLGGTNLRVCEFHLEGQGKFSVHQQKYVVSDQLKKGEMRHLCDFIADCVDNFISEHGSDHLDEALQLGFTFSFPVLQTAINRGTLMHWTKGFNCSGAINKDVVVMLQDAFLRKNLNVNIAAIVNDTVGTLMAHTYLHPETTIGVILGTGTNACYYEKATGIKKWKTEKQFDDMVINMEWGAFDNERRVLPLTIYDNKLDRESINPRQQIFEKQISGMYLGEIVRNAMLHLVDQWMLFNGQSSADLNKQWGFETAYMTTIIADNTPALASTEHILQDVLQIETTTLEDRQIVKHICDLVARRAARLSAAGIAAVLSHTGDIDRPSVVAIDGSVYEFLPGFENNMIIALKELFGDSIQNRIKFALAKDGSGFGAAIVAMVAHKAATSS
ncbi:hexokinase-domain-containing protein [Halteromyces radiatus]|uniref:hexokinase-domain-containing protein n=1 Tax=Halteromyces radiatus TaxID=101107 RepID=UPI0022211013|nr:hexokinase-domain-containing protein [Halteromyces radiatus]KAI8092464.1 hexokinase-domain-containing protein [Halteromyces radiatus]